MFVVATIADVELLTLKGLGPRLNSEPEKFTLYTVNGARICISDDLLPLISDTVEVAVVPLQGCC